MVLPLHPLLLQRHTTKAFSLNRELFADERFVRVCHMLLPLVQKVLPLKGAFTGTLDSIDGKRTGFLQKTP